MRPFYDLRGRVALVIGGGGDTGGASALALAKAGADVIILDVRPEAAAERAETIRSLGRRSMVLIGDCADDTVVRALTQKALLEFGHVDILVSVVGGGEPHLFWELIQRVPHWRGDQTPQSVAVGRKPGEPFSQRELEIIRLLDEGLTNVEIAARLRLSRRTISNHLDRMYNRHGMKNRLSLVRFAREVRLI